MNTRAMLCGFCAACVLTDMVFAAQPRYSVTDLGAPGESAVPSSLNEHGEAAYYTLPSGFDNSIPPLGDFTIPGRSWRVSANLGYTQLTGLGGNADVVTAINNRGDAVGVSRPSGFNTVSFSVSWQNEGVSTLPALPSGNSSAPPSDINDSGQILVGEGDVKLYLYSQSEGYREIPTLGAHTIRGSDLSEKGEVVGMSLTTTDPDTFAYEPFYYAKGVTSSLGTLGGNRGAALAINEAGHVVGYSQDSQGITRAVLWTHAAGLVDLEVNHEAIATDVNDSGLVVGSAYPLGILESGRSQEAFLYTPTSGTLRLDDLIPPDSKWEHLMSAVAINNRGQILGLGVFDGERRIYLAVPIPEPRTYFLALLTLGGATGSLRVRGDRAQ